jgi:O-antigen ligase
MLVAGVLAGAALALLVGGDPVGAVGERPLLGVAALVGVGAVVAVAFGLRARPVAFALVVVAVVPFRVPVPAGDDTANLLVPLYGVIAAGWLAFAAPWLRGRRRPGGPGSLAAAGGPEGESRVDVAPALRLRQVLAAVLVLYGVQSLYSTDVDQAVENLAFFYVPFALLLALLLEAPVTDWAVRGTFRVAVGLALVCAVVGIGEFATGHLLISNEKVLEANELKPYFRVNSLFFDPNIYGRFLALAMIALAAALLWSRLRTTVALAGAALAVLWAGLVLSLSQSSFAALLAGLAILAALRWRVVPVLAAGAVTALATIAVVVAAPAAVGIESGSERELDRATSGRVELVQGALRMIGDRPLTGFGSGSFAERYRAREDVRTEEAAAISHTTPLTIAAEQGILGLGAYVALVVAALWVLFAGLPGAVGGATPGVRALARAAVAAAFCAVLLHTYAYASFLEDPVTWVLLALGATLAAAQQRAHATEAA